MDGFWRLTERLRALLFPGRVEREVAEEMRFHLEMETRELEARGLSPEEAQRRARIAFGSVERYRAEVRESRWGHPLESFGRDLLFGLRTLRRDPIKTGAILLSLGLGIGTGAAVLSLAQGLLLTPLPYPSADEALWIETQWKGQPRGAISPAEYLDYRDHLKEIFSGVGVYSFGATNFTGDGEPERLATAFTTASLFEVLGAEPLRGRFFTVEEELSSETPVVLSEGLWRRRFGAAEDIVGRELTLSGRPARVVGVMPSALRLPERLFQGSGVDLFLPQGIDPATVTNRGSHYLSGIARRHPEISAEQAIQTLEIFGERMAREEDYPRDMGLQVTATPLADAIRGPVQAPLRLLLGAVGVLLLITCVNVALLLLGDLDRRRREMSLRAVLGAGRNRLFAQTVTESLLLASLGGLLGLGTAWLLAGPATSVFTGDLPWLANLHPDPRILLYSLVLAMICGLLCGAVPAFAAGGLRLDVHLGGGRTTSGSRRTRRWQRGLVIAEVALAVILLSGSSLLTYSLLHLLRVDPGFRSEHVVAAQLSLPLGQYDEAEEVTTFYREVVPRLRALPGVESAGAVSNLPLATRLGDMSFDIEGREVPEDQAKPAADWQVVTPGYFETLGLTVTQGRGIHATDRSETTGVLVINQTFAEEHWPGEDPIGQRLRLGGEQTAPRFVEVVGVVGDVRHEHLAQDRRPQMYLAHEQFRFWSNGFPHPSLTLVVQSQRPAAELRDEMASAIHALDADLPLAGFRSLASVRRAALAVPRLLVLGLTFFAGVALLLAAVGLYGILDHAVRIRRPELGLRLALGARPTELGRRVFARGLGLSLIGLIAGGLGALALHRLLAGLLYGVTPGDPRALAPVLGILLLVAVLACWLPARRARRADPSRLLRAE